MLIFALLFGFVARSAETNKPLLLLGDKDYPPITYLEGDIPHGLDVDLAEALSKQMGRPIRVELTDWDGAQKRVLADEADGLLGMCVSEDRKALYDFTDSTFSREFAFFVRASALPLDGARALAGRKVAVTSGGLPRSVLMSAQPPLNLVLVKNYQDGFRQLAAGTIDVVAADLWVGAYTVQKERLEGITVSGEPFARAPAAIALKKGNLALVAELNRALQELNRGGTLARIQHKWHPQEILFVSRDRVRSLVVIGGVVALGLICCGLGFWVLTLRRQMRIRRSVEMALRQSEERYKAIAESAPHGITVSIQDELVYVNPAAARIVGASNPGQLLGRSFYDFVCEEFHEQVRQRRKEMLESGRPAPVMTGKARRLDGQIIEIEGGGTPVIYGGKQAIQNTFTDVTQRKRVEEALQQSETRYRTLFESAQDAIFLIDEGRFKDCNLRTVQLFGCNREEILEQTPEHFSPLSQPDGLDSRQQAQLRIAKAMAGETQRFEWRHRRLDGSEFDAEVSLNRLTLGQRDLLLAIVRDITKRKQAEEALHRQAAFDEIIGALLGRLASSSGTDIDEQVLSILKEIGLFIGVDLTFVLHINSEQMTWSCTHEWCAPGIQGQRARHQDVVIEPGSWCIRQVWAGKLVNVRSLSELPPEASLTRQRWEDAGYKAVIEVPLRTKGGQVYGCVGLLSFSKEGPWADADIRRLQMVGDAIANGLERKAAKRRLEASREQLRALSSRLQSLREEERTRISREIHDHLGQLLTALKLDLRSLDRKILENVSVSERPALSNKVASARDLADEMITSVQKIASELRPGILDRLGLAAAIEAEGQAFQARTGIHCHWNVTEKPLETSQDQAIGMFRIFQELLTNVARHAQATEVEVCLDQSQGKLALEVCDNGVGIRKGDIENPQSLGLLGMEERATMLGGNLRFDTSSCKGTRVTVQIPLVDELKKA